MPSQSQLLTAEPPLVIDLDGTLIRTDLLLESAFALLRESPFAIAKFPGWLLRGKAAIKQELACATQIDVTRLPYNEAVVAWIGEERRRGRQIVLATASHRSLADKVAAHLMLFDQTFATDAGRNLSARAKRDALVQSFGERGFDYAGNAAHDLPVWRAARKAWVVDASAATERSARAIGNVAGTIRSEPMTSIKALQALRMHQWLKNLLLFVPLVMAHRFGEIPLATDALIAFLCFGLCASGTYLFNDLLDLQDDRHHPRKRFRSIASGRLPIGFALAVGGALVVGAFALAAWKLPPGFVGALATYLALTSAYTFWLKRRMIVDVMTLAALYTLRVIAGALAVGVPLSFWLLAFSMFIFFSLALVKRHVELFPESQAVAPKNRGRGYVEDDRHMVAALGAASGCMAVLVLALYINDPRTAQLYRHPELIWLACPLLLAWVSRVWMLAHRGRMHDDPVVFALHDRVSLAIGALVALVFTVAA